MKANLICGILALNLLAIDKAIECFKQLEFDDGANWFEAICSEDDLSYYVALVVLSAQNYDAYRDLVSVG